MRKRTHQVTTYFDTADTTLALLGLSLRVRRAEARFVQTLKADRTAGVAANRAEWEWPVEANSPDLTLLAETSRWQLPPKLDLQPVVVTTIDRTVRVIQHADGTEIEAALDEGVISAGDAHQPVRELELELRRGRLSSLLEWAIELHAAVPLMIETETKAQRGYRLRGAIPGLSNNFGQKADEVAPGPDAPAAEAFQLIVTAALGHLLVNQPASLAGEARGLRQMRLAIRRLRSSLALFKPHLEPDATSRFQYELRRIGHLLKDAQDWNVFCFDTLPEAMPGDILLRPLAAAAREAAHHELVSELRAPSFTALVLGLAAWVERGALTDAARLQPLGQIASPLLDRLAKKLDERGRPIEHQSEPEWLALGKAFKDLRHGVEHLASAYPKHAANAWLSNCAPLRTALRKVNGRARACALAAHLGHEGQPALAQAIAALSTQLRQRRDDALPDLAEQWNKLQAYARFWV